MRRFSIALSLAVAVVAIAAGCGRASNGTAEPPPSNTGGVTLGSGPAATSTPAEPPRTTQPSAPAWPSPEDCVSYNPATINAHYEAGIWDVSDGSHEVMRVHGGPDAMIGDQLEALAKRYRKHCFLGRSNTRQEQGAYSFDYWRNASGQTPTIPGLEDACSSYDRNNLTVEDMGGGQGWRVKDHDHVLHLFDNERDARNGRLVISKYGRICSIGDSGDGELDVVTFSL